MRLQDLTGHQKAAILMIAIGVDAASQLLKSLDEKEIEQISAEIMNLREVPGELMDEVVQEFLHLIRAQEFVAVGGLDYATKLLQGAVGRQKARDIVKRVNFVQEELRSGFTLLRQADDNNILNLISNEHPQTIALVLAYLESSQAANIIRHLNPKLQQEVVYRIATMEKISGDLLVQIEDSLKGQIETANERELNDVGGKNAVAEILNMAGKTLEKPILDEISKRNEELAREIRGLMFTFEDIQRLDDKSLQRFLKEVDTKLLTIALKGSTEDIKERIFANMSARAAEMIQEEMEYMGPLRVKEVDDAQRQLVDIIRSLEDEGEIVIMGGDSENEFVV